MKLKTLAAMAVFALANPAFADGHKSVAPDGASVYFINLADGDTVTSPVLVQFGLRGMGVAPAGQEIDNTGHHHILLNRPALGLGPDGDEEWEWGLPADDNHRHYGKGQTEAMLDLAPGEHTLQMVFGNWGHVPFGPELVTEVITITVSE